jgi:hypothetical protein
MKNEMQKTLNTITDFGIENVVAVEKYLPNDLVLTEDGETICYKDVIVGVDGKLWSDESLAIENVESEIESEIESLIESQCELENDWLMNDGLDAYACYDDCGHLINQAIDRYLREENVSDHIKSEDIAERFDSSDVELVSCRDYSPNSQIEIDSIYIGETEIQIEKAWIIEMLSQTYDGNDDLLESIVDDILSNELSSYKNGYGFTYNYVNETIGYMVLDSSSVDEIVEEISEQIESFVIENVGDDFRLSVSDSIYAGNCFEVSSGVATVAKRLRQTRTGESLNSSELLFQFDKQDILDLLESGHVDDYRCELLTAIKWKLSVMTTANNYGYTSLVHEDVMTELKR